jgi:hypothetical protein
MYASGGPGRTQLRARALIGLVILSVLAALAGSSCSAVQAALPFSSPSARVLFIGNSFTFVNDGVDQHLTRLDRSIYTQRLAVGGYTLEDHWNSRTTIEKIHAEKWDYVVLQEQSQTPVVGQSRFIEYAGKLSSEIKSIGAQPVLFMTWERPDSAKYGVTSRNLANAYYKAGSRLGAQVAPAGLAFASALAERPDLALYVNDGHPTVAGTYLATCVLYATLTGKSPAGLSYAPGGISKADRDFLQRIAAAATGH